MGQKPLELWIVRQINKLTHEHGLKRMVVARRLGISRSAVRAHLVSSEQWFKDKKDSSL